MECIICRRACARTMEFIILSMRKTENMVYSFDNKDDINKIKIHDCAFYGFGYKQKKSEVEIYCKNEMTKEEIIIRFRSVMCIYMQSCRFWAGGNNIQCMYAANGDRFIPVGMEINSGDELVICCEELEVI